MTTTPGSFFVVIDGVRLHWAEEGTTVDHVPVVLLHGLNDSHLTWKPVASGLAVDRRVLSPDLPGHGLSDRPNASYELRWHAQLIAKWLDVMGLAEVDVVGHSFGGGVAQFLLLESSAKIRRVILVASGGLGREVAFSLRLASLPRIVELLGQPFMGYGTKLALRGAGLSPQQIAEMAAMNESPGSARAFARTVRDVIDWRGQRPTFFARAHELPRLPPIAVFWGDRDRIIPISHANAFVEGVEGVQFRRFAGCGHHLHVEQPEELVRTARAFLDDPNIPPARLRAARPIEKRDPAKRDAPATTLEGSTLPVRSISWLSRPIASLLAVPRRTLALPWMQRLSGAASLLMKRVAGHTASAKQTV